jgi:heme-degrading monooxygenase HmoA
VTIETNGATPLIAVVFHQAKEGMFHDAAARVAGNGERMAQAPGFISRELLMEASGLEEVATITKWASVDLYEQWVAFNRASNPHPGSPTPYLGSPETHLYLPYRKP